MGKSSEEKRICKKFEELGIDIKISVSIDEKKVEKCKLVTNMLTEMVDKISQELL